MIRFVAAYLFVGCVLCTTAAHAAPDDSPGDWRETGTSYSVPIDVDAEGRVIRAVPPQTSLSAPLVESMRQAVMGWRFEPATMNGKPAAVHSFVTVKMSVRKAANSDQYDVTFAYASNGPRFGTKTPPSYPPNMVRKRVEAVVIFAARVTKDGQLADGHVVSAATTGGVPASSFSQAVLRQLATWTAEPETVEGVPVETEVSFPVYFTLHSGSTRLSAINASKPTTQLLQAKDSPASPPSELPADGSLAAVNSPLHLKTAAL